MLALTLLKMIVLTMVQVFGDDKAILTSVADDLEYGSDNKPTGRVLGTRYGVVCPKRKYAALTVKVPGLPPVITQAEIDNSEDPIWISFDSYVGKIFSMNGEIGISSKADKAMLVPAPKAKG